jgi:hypothetical protein
MATLVFPAFALAAGLTIATWILADDTAALAGVSMLVTGFLLISMRAGFALQAHPVSRSAVRTSRRKRVTTRSVA